jgi:hypothetical protein
MTPWKRIPDYLPVDATVVWVRQDYWCTPFLATWHLGSGLFTRLDGLTVPWYACQRFRLQDPV